MDSRETPAKAAKQNPRPVRFEDEDDAFIRLAVRETGMSVSDVIRRSVRFARQQHSLSRNLTFMLHVR
jgi:hypothetical protein